MSELRIEEKFSDLIRNKNLIFGKNAEDLTPLTEEIISKQATINIGTIGHVAHGKSTLVRTISGVQTVRFKQELERNITIKLGYANAKIYRCDNPECPEPGCYRSCGSSAPNQLPCQREGCGGTFQLKRHVSFVDCPGHDIFMATMLNGTAVMEAALLLVAGNETCPQPQTQEHLAAIEIMQLESIIILQNKIDIIEKERAVAQCSEIRDFVKGTTAQHAPIIPISAQLKLNIDAVCQYICETIPVPKRDFVSPARLIIIRSFDINKPGCVVHDLKGGVAGGTILQGVLSVGQEIEIRPGIVTRDQEAKLHCRPIFSKIVSLYAEQNELEHAVPGGLIGVGTNIDPILCRSDRLVGHLLGAVGTLPNIYTQIEFSYYLMRRYIGVRAAEGEVKKVKKFVQNEMLLVNIGSQSVGAMILAFASNMAKVELTTPVCTEIGERIALSRRVGNNWRLIGWGEIKGGEKVELK